jgi:hypothetical protein
VTADIVIWQRLGATREQRRDLKDLALAAHAGARVDDSTISTTCRLCGDPMHGKPRLVGVPDCFFNASSAGDVAMIAVGSADVGLDVAKWERLQALDFARVDVVTGGALASAARWLPAGADRRLAWVVYEALAKGLGLGVFAGVADIEKARGAWSIRLYRPTTKTVACVATVRPHPTVAVRWRPQPTATVGLGRHRVGT